METSWLIQRLQKPFPKQPKDKKPSLLESLDLSFGGGLPHGGISKVGMELIKDIFRFDYMGSSEFEWGAVPKAMQVIVENRQSYIATKMYIEKPIKTPIYIICNKADLTEVTKRIERFASEWHHNTQERVCLYEVINKKPYNDYCGWLELDNGYFFFTDKEMFEKTAKLFGVTQEEAKKAKGDSNG